MRRGCLIVALGSPAAPTKREIRRFLAPFLSDRRVVDFHPFVWQPILRGIVLPFRPGRIQAQYEHIWLSEGSPLTVHTKAQRDHLSGALPEVDVRYAMTYTSPSIPEVLSEMDVDELTVLPLYPQYAASTVAPVFDQVTEYYRSRSSMPTLHLVKSWETSPLLIEWYAREVHRTITAHELDRLVFSYHGVPERAVHAPEEYTGQCRATTEAIMDAVAELDPSAPRVPFDITYQSKFGPGKWLTPATIDSMAAYPGNGVTRIGVATPGFFADCIETVDEIDILNRETFMNAGGKDFVCVAPPNSDIAVGPMLAEVYHAFTPDRSASTLPSHA